MQWYHYVSIFFSGLFLSNVVPHYVKGVSGDAFPTPFSKPPGKGLSSPMVNVLWSLFNLVVGYVLFRVGRFSWDDCLSLLVFFVGFAGLSIMHANNFVKKDKI
jgi:hypothetical protein